MENKRPQTTSEQLTVAKKSSDLNTSSVGERREIVDDEDV